MPTVVCGYFWGDWRGGYFIAGVARLVFVHHSTFFVNSLAHYWGDSEFSDQHTAKNSIITALVTVGEGYHNFHHEFPSDFRNGVRWYHYDPTKWFILAMEKLGLAYDLKRFPKNEIVKGTLQMREKALERDKRAVAWPMGAHDADVPVYTMEEVRQQVREHGRRWLVIDGFVVDVEKFAPSHPGSATLVLSFVGQDVTDKFKGGVYKVRHAGHNTSRLK